MALFHRGSENTGSSCGPHHLVEPSTFIHQPSPKHRMATHLSHKLPWGTLVDLFLLHPAPVRGVYQPFYVYISRQQHKELQYFAKCFVRAVQEFRESDRSTDEELHLYDPRRWSNNEEFGIGGPTRGFLETLFSGYVGLNLILSDPVAVLARFSPVRGCPDQDVFKRMLGSDDGGHPDEFADHLKQATDGYQFKPVTNEIAQVLRDHAAMMFRSMYSVSGRNRFLDVDTVVHKILQACRLQCPRDLRLY